MGMGTGKRGEKGKGKEEWKGEKGCEEGKKRKKEGKKVTSILEEGLMEEGIRILKEYEGKKWEEWDRQMAMGEEMELEEEGGPPPGFGLRKGVGEPLGAPHAY